MSASIAAEIVAALGDHGKKIVLVDRGEPIDGTTLREAILDRAGAIVAAGLEPGQRVLIVLPNGLEFSAQFLGVLLAGGIAVPTWPDSSPERLRDLGALCDASMVIDEESPLIDSRGARPSSWPDAPVVAMLQYTSGSTADPKGVMLSHAGLIGNIEQMRVGFGLRSDDVFYSWLPACHDMGLILMLLSPLLLGATVHLERPGMPSLKGWMKNCAEVKATVTAGPDFSWRMALRTLGRSEPPRPPLRVALDAAEPVRSATLEAVEATFGVRPTPAYGLAEATVGVCGSVPREAFRVDDRGLVALGLPFPGVELRIVDEEGVMQDSGVVGLVEMRTPAACLGYWGNPQATADLFRGDGWLRTGDLGSLDELGELRISGRAKSVIIVAGRTVAAQEVEETVDEIAEVRRSAAVPLDRGGAVGEQLVVLAELRPRAENTELRPIHASVIKAVERRLGFPPGKVLLLRRKSIALTKNGKVRHATMVADLTSGKIKESVLFPDHEAAV